MKNAPPPPILEKILNLNFLAGALRTFFRGRWVASELNMDFLFSRCYRNVLSLSTFPVQYGGGGGQSCSLIDGPSEDRARAPNPPR